MRNETAVYGIDDGIDFDARYTAVGYSGVAWVLIGWAQTWEPELSLVTDDDGNELWDEIGDGEWVPDRGNVIAVMVGDDRRFTFDRDDVTVIPEDGFCHGCGQVGCTAEVWS